MDKFQYGNYDSTQTDLVFDSQKGYIEVAGEVEARKQLSSPLNEIKDFVNNTSAVKTNNPDTIVQLGINQDDLLQYRTTKDGAWQDTGNSGHIIVIDDGVNPPREMPQRMRLEFRGANIHGDDDRPKSRTIISGLQGPKGDTGERGPQGYPGLDGNSFIIIGYYETIEQLRTEQVEGNIGDAWAVGTTQPFAIYVWGYNGTTEQYEWTFVGNLAPGPRGPQGPEGLQGETGPQGPKGDSGEGVPVGGTSGQILSKVDDEDYNVQWIDNEIVDQVYDGTSANAQSGVAVASGISDAITSNIDQTYDGTSAKAQSGTAVASAISTKANSNHTHGYINNDGTVGSSAVSTGDKIVITDANYSNKIVQSNITFDGQTTNQVLSKKGTWVGLPTDTNTFAVNPKDKKGEFETTTGVYTATADCIVFVVVNWDSNAYQLYVRPSSGADQSIAYMYGGTKNDKLTVPLRKGDSVVCYSTFCKFIVFGVK